MAKELTSSSGILNAVYALKNVFFSFLGTIILLFIGAVAATYLTASETAISLTVAVITAACIMWGGFRSSRHFGRQGLICGALSGLLYVVLLYFIGSLVLGRISFNVATALSMLIGIGCGAIGGIVGVNTRSKRRR